jgi:ribosome-associated protein
MSDASWVLMDYGDVIIHAFLAETRTFYDLDHLWADATRVDWSPEPSAVPAQ